MWAMGTGRVWIGALAALITLAADQASKWWILDVLDLPARGQVVVLPFLNLTMVWNQGVTFGLLRQDSAWGPWILSGVALLVVVALGAWLRRAENWFTAAALGAIAGGAVGNVIDRARFGAVVDFLHAHRGRLVVVRVQRGPTPPSCAGRGAGGGRLLPGTQGCLIEGAAGR